MKRQINHRQLCLESLEQRELLSVSLNEFPAAETVQTADAASDSERNVPTASAEPPVVFTEVSPAVVNLAPPKPARPASTATPSTLTIYWSSPVASSSLNTEEITYFKITVQDSKTKGTVFEGTADVAERSFVIENLEPKTRYLVLVTSCGGEGTNSAKGTLKITAATAAFPAITARKTAVSLNTATLTLTDKDKITPFVDGKTVKEYTVEITGKKTANWANAQSVVIPSGTNVLDVKKGTFSVDVSGLQPDTDYLVRITAAYTDGTKELSVTGKAISIRTAKVPAVSIAKSFFTVLDKTDYQFAVGTTAKIASLKTLGETPVKLTVYVSTGSAVDKATKALLNSVAVSAPAEAEWDSKGLFTMPSVSMDTLAAALGRSNLLAAKTLTFQFLLTFEFSGGGSATAYSKTGRLTLPAWY
ncbi:MAG: fibronectin type III domain-containing protein [Planctomycetaceae bacterium]|jgi:hypothetical protein|nr:fibronectin type III domain-containing protein [Planctomycetaceae bacterium]